MHFEIYQQLRGEDEIDIKSLVELEGCKNGQVVGSKSQVHPLSLLASHKLL